MDYFQIAKRAWEIVKHNKFLWWLGILAIFTEGGAGNLFSYSSNWDDFIPSEESTPIDPGTGSTQGVARILGASTSRSEMEASLNRALDWSASHWQIVLPLILLLIIIGLVITYISFAARAGLILSINDIEDKKEEKWNFKKAFHTGRDFAWRLWGMNILIGLACLLFIALLMAPIVAIFIVGGNSTSAVFSALGLALLGILFFLILIIYFSIVARLAERSIVLEKLKIIESLKHGHSILFNRKSETVLSWLVSILIGLAYGMVVLVVMMFAGLILLAFGLIIYSVFGELVVVILAAIAGIALFALTLAVNGIFTAFLSAYWTIAYRALKHLKKINSAKGE